MAKKHYPHFQLAKNVSLRILFILLFIVVLIGVIGYARGYRPDFKSKSIVPTGILAMSSSPKAAKIYINGALKGVTDLNLTLPPGEYKVEMKKEGYTDWSRIVTLKGEVVMSLDGILFPKNPSLSPLTSLGVVKAVPVDHTNRIILFSNNGDQEKDGLYIFETTQKPLSLLPPLKPLLLKKYLPQDVEFENATVEFSPDYRQGIIEFPTGQTSVSYLLSLDEENTQLFDITNSKEALLSAWKIEKNQEVAKIFETFPKEIVRSASDSIHIIDFSPDETKMLYQAKKSLLLPFVITPALLGASQMPESRTLQPGKLYVYDRKEDKNFEVKGIQLDSIKSKLSPTPVRRFTTPTPTVSPLVSFAGDDFSNIIQWYSDSKHFVINEKKDLIVADYDGANKWVVYSGPFHESFFNVTEDGRVMVLTNLNLQYNKSPDLYVVGIR